jgi:NMD protein affecting ribosome stability and mRNA decay
MDKQKIREEMQNFIEEIPEHAYVKKKAVKGHIPKKHKHCEYFEGEIQMRNITPEILTYVQRRIANEKEFVPTSKIHNDTDIDYSVSSKTLIKKIGHELKKKFGGEVKEAAEHFSRDNQTSKNIYRYNLLYRKLDYDVGNIVECESIKEPCKVSGLKGDKLVLFNTVKLTKTNVPEKTCAKLETFQTQVVQIKPMLLVLDEAFQSAPAVSGLELTEGQNVVCCMKDGMMYVVKT